MPRPHIALLAALIAAVVFSHFSDNIDPYFLDVLIGIGINIILAVSRSTSSTATPASSRWGTRPSCPSWRVSVGLRHGFSRPETPRRGRRGTALGQNSLFSARRFLAGGLSAALAGLLIGIHFAAVESSGDYLALVTPSVSAKSSAWFSRTSTPSAAPLGFVGLPAYTNFAWTYWGRRAHGLRRRLPS